jgi:hypothetical protein
MSIGFARDPTHNPEVDMSLRLEVLVPITTAVVCALLGCGEKSDGTAGASGANSGGTSTGGSGTSGGSSNGGGGMISTGGSASGSATVGGASGGGASGGGASGGVGGSAGATAGTGGGAGAGSGNKSKTTFFVTSDTSKTGKLGGLEMADKRCQDLAMKAGIGDHTFHAYLSTSTGNAKDRIGQGPWVNSAGVTIAENLTALHAGTLVGNPELFIDENKMKIHGQWDGGPIEHDVLTGSKADGTVQTGVTCQDWTSDVAADMGQVGHSDGMGLMKSTAPPANSWNSAHASGSCADTSKAGGAGRLYCFAID